MGTVIQSSIDVEYSCNQKGCDMDKKHTRKHRKNPNPEQVKPHTHHYKSEAKTDKNRFFHQTTNKGQGATQTTTVNVTVAPSDDPVTGCFKGLFKCFGG